MTTAPPPKVDRAAAPRPVEHPSAAERAGRGRSARATVPRSSHAAFDPPSTRTSPVDILERQAATRVPELVPIRHGRMLASAFAFFRGGAAIMAADLAHTPQSGLRVQCCGDAHLSNFGGFAAPDRAMVFDINDFDETLPGPWEWDVKRLATSFEIAARDLAMDAGTSRSLTSAVARSYRVSMRGFAGMRHLDVWYERLDAEHVLDRWRQRVTAKDVKRVEQNVAKARTKDSLKAFAKLTHEVDGQIRIVSDPPIVVPLDELLTPQEADALRGEIQRWFRAYRHSLASDRRHLLETFRLVDLAHKVVGVGSVGTRAWIALLLGRDDADPLFLQIKEAEASVLEPYVGRSGLANHGQRVVEGQLVMQAASDIFLGWNKVTGVDGVERDYYVRQLWDAKLSPDIETMPLEVLGVYAEMCGWTLARAHARSGDRIAIASYLGSGDTFDRAIADFAVAYADQNQRDFETVAAAVRAGRLAADPAPAGR